jgi:hypothetical protein
MFMWDDIICHKGKGVVESSRSWCVVDEVKGSPPSNNIEFHDYIVKMNTCDLHNYNQSN